MLQRSLNSETGRKTRNQRNLIPKEEMDCRPQTQYVTRFVPALRLDKFSSNSALYKESSHPLKYPAWWEKVDKSFQNCTSWKKIENIKQLYEQNQCFRTFDLFYTSISSILYIRRLIWSILWSCSLCFLVPNYSRSKVKGEKWES